MGFELSIDVRCRCVLVALAITSVASALRAETVYVDFGDAAGPTAEPESYNEVVPSASGPNTSLDEPNGEDFLNLVDTNNVATGIDLNLMVTSDVGDARAGAGPYVHDPVSGISSNALNDGLWLNCGTAAPNTFGFRLAFTDLPSERYDINLTCNEGGDINNNWWIATGTGDNRTNLVTAANDRTKVVDWRNVAPVDGTIVIKSQANATTTWKNKRLGFVSLTAVPTVLIGWHSPDALPDTTPDMGIDGVTGAISGGFTFDTDGNCTDGTYGVGPGAALDAANAFTVKTGGNHELFLTVTNHNQLFLVLDTIHFDYGRWWGDSPQDVALYYDSGDLSAADGALINSYAGATQLNSRSGDYDDFDWNLGAALGDITLSKGQSATFRFVVSNSGDDTNAGAFDNIAITGYLTRAGGLKFIVR